MRVFDAPLIQNRQRKRLRREIVVQHTHPGYGNVYILPLLLLNRLYSEKTTRHTRAEFLDNAVREKGYLGRILWVCLHIDLPAFSAVSADSCTSK